MFFSRNSVGLNLFQEAQLVSLLFTKKDWSLILIVSLADLPFPGNWLVCESAVLNGLATLGMERPSKLNQVQ